MLGTSGRIGEVLAIRKIDVDVTSTPATVRICGTIVSPTGKPTYRQDHPKTSKSTRRVSVPSFTAAVLRERLVVVADKEPDHLVLHAEPDSADDPAGSHPRSVFAPMTAPTMSGGSPGA